jgi:hypothetical protein
MKNKAKIRSNNNNKKDFWLFIFSCQFWRYPMSKKFMLNVINLFFLWAIFFCGARVFAYGPSLFADEVEAVQAKTASFKEKQDLSSLKDAVISATNLLRAIEEKNAMDDRFLKKTITFRHLSWAARHYQGLVDDHVEESYQTVHTTLDHYTKPLTPRESKKTGRHSPREIAKHTCAVRQDSLEFARQEYLNDCLFAYCLGEYLSTPGLDDMEKQGLPLYHTLSRIEDCYTKLSELFWSIEEVLVRRAVREQKKSLLHKKSPRLKELMDYWHVGSNAVVYREWMNTVLSTRFKLFFYAYSGAKNSWIMKATSGSFLESGGLGSSSSSLSTTQSTESSSF